jgi:hypothetical protein
MALCVCVCVCVVGSKGCVIRFGQAVPTAPPPYIASRKRREVEKYSTVQQQITDLFDRVGGRVCVWRVVAWARRATVSEPGALC